MRSTLALLMALATAYVGFMFVGKYKLESRLSQVREQAKGVCSTRGRDTPSVEQLSQALAQIADDSAVQLSEVDVSIHPLGAGHDTAAGTQVEAAFGGTGGGLQMTGSMAELHARMQAKQWLWHADEALSASCTLERKLERVLPPSLGVDPE